MFQVGEYAKLVVVIFNKLDSERFARTVVNLGSLSFPSFNLLISVTILISVAFIAISPCFVSFGHAEYGLGLELGLAQKLRQDLALELEAAIESSVAVPFSS